MKVNFQTKRIIKEQNYHKIKYIEEISSFYRNQMNDFFEEKKIADRQRDRIIRILRNKFPQFNAEIKNILSAIKHLESQNLIYHLSYVKVIRVLLNNMNDYPTVVMKLKAIQEKKMWRMEADNKFKSKYGKVEM
mgnify:CR=1 FL=1